MAIAGVTGHRPDKLGGYLPNPIADFVMDEMRRRFLRIKPTHIITGMALGVDQWAARIALELGIPFIAAVPFAGQELAWRDESQRDEYRELLELADSVHIVSGGGYTKAKMHVRNRWIVDSSDVMVVVLDTTADLRGSGTLACMQYAMARGVPIEHIDPSTRLAA